MDTKFHTEVDYSINLLLCLLLQQRCLLLQPTHLNRNYANFQAPELISFLKNEMN